MCLLVHLLCAKAQTRRARVFLFLNTFLVISVRPINYLNIYRTDIHEICRIGRTLAVDERSEVIFFDPLGDVAVATNFVGKIFLQYTPCSSYDIR